MKTMYDTSYTEEFANKDDDNETVPSDLSDYIKNMSVNEKRVISKMLHSVNGKGKESVERISSWDGPSWK